VRRAFTLIELLVVIAIIAVVLTISVGMLSRFGSKNALDANHQAVRGLLRRAHNASREERHGATVELDRRAAELRAQLKASITRFRCEDAVPLPAEEGTRFSGESSDDETPPPFETTGSRDYVLKVDGGEQVQGHPGLGVLFEQEGDYGAAWAKVEERASLSPLDGVHVSCWIKLGNLADRLPERPRADPSLSQEELWNRGGEPPRTTPPRSSRYTRSDPPIFYVARKGRAWSLGITAAYEVEVAVTGPEDPELTYVTRTKPGTVSPYRWTSVAFSFDGRRVEIKVGGIPRRHLRVGSDDLTLFEQLDGVGASEVEVDGERVDGSQVLDEVELAQAGELGQLLLDGGDRGGWGNGDGLLTRAEFLERVPARLIRDPSPLVLSDPHPERAFYGVIDEVHVAAVLRSSRLALPAEVAVIAPTDTIGYDLMGQLDPALHAEPVVLYLTDDQKAWDVIDPQAGAGAPGDPSRTQTRAEQAERQRRRKALLTDRGVYERFEAALTQGKLDPSRVRRVVVGRTGLVSE
jgi:prepilin-type N-terminal cleavage/methylation domain-containing protein